jgi:hypothetical protein
MVQEHLFLRDFGPYGTIFMIMCAVITVAMVILLRDIGCYGIICVTVHSF